MFCLRNFPFSSIVASLFFLALPGGVLASTAEEIKGLTERPTRLVWTRILTAPKNDLNATVLKNSQLVGYDTEDGRGERVILNTPGDYGKPMLTPDGQQVIYSSSQGNRWYLVDFEGSEPREMGEGYASDIWTDPATGIVWVYVRTPSRPASGKIIRVSLENPSVNEVIFTEAPTGHAEVPWFQLSVDGRVAADAFPWPKCGIAYLGEQNTWVAKGNGCWPSIAADNSYRMMHFKGVHTEMALYEPGQPKARKIPISNIPGIKGQRLYHPRWGKNNTNFITVTGPQWTTKTELYLGKFDTGLTKVDQWVKVSSNEFGEAFGDVWIEPLPKSAKELVTRYAPAPPIPPSWPVDSKHLAWVWENWLANNQIREGDQLKTCEVKFRGGTVLTPRQGMDLTGGWAEARNEAERKVVAACQKNKALTLEVTFTATDDDPKEAMILGMINPNGKARNFALFQKRDRLVFEIRHSKSTDTEISLGKVIKGAQQHVMVTFKKGKIEAWLDGRQVVSDTGLGDFKNWLGNPLLVFGGEKRGNRWEGMMEGVAIYSIALSHNQVAEAYTLAEKRGFKQPARQTVVVKARVKEVSEIPDPNDIDYPRSLARDLWEIESVESGEIREKEIAVTRWVILDRRVVPGADDLKVGDTAELLLHHYEDRPELSGEHQTNDLSVFDAAVYHNAGH